MYECFSLVVGHFRHIHCPNQTEKNAYNRIDQLCLLKNYIFSFLHFHKFTVNGFETTKKIPGLHYVGKSEIKRKVQMMVASQRH